MLREQPLQSLSEQYTAWNSIAFWEAWVSQQRGRGAMVTELAETRVETHDDAHIRDYQILFDRNRKMVFILNGEQL